jgi:hypothetical protein
MMFLLNRAYDDVSARQVNGKPTSRDLRECVPFKTKCFPEPYIRIKFILTACSRVLSGGANPTRTPNNNPAILFAWKTERTTTA